MTTSCLCDRTGKLTAELRGHSMVFETPDNVVELLDGAVRAAMNTQFYRAILPPDVRIASMEDFRSLPVTPIARYRRQRLGSVVAQPSRVQWIAGTLGGQARSKVAVAEGLDDTASRYGVFRDALRDAFPEAGRGPAAIVAEPHRRYFAAEISTILGHLGIPAHVFPSGATPTTLAHLGRLEPRILVLLAGGVDRADPPPSVELCVTFRGSYRRERFRQLDLYLVDELGFLGHSTDLRRWVVYNDQYLFETSRGGRLVVTALRNRTQPLIRLETMDAAEHLGEHHLKFARLDPSG